MNKYTIIFIIIVFLSVTYGQNYKIINLDTDLNLNSYTQLNNISSIITADNGTLFMTHDDWTTFRKIKLSTMLDINDAVSYDRYIIGVGKRSLVVKSDDFGETWIIKQILAIGHHNPISNLTDFNTIVYNNGVFFAGGNNMLIMKSYDYGNTWISINPGIFGGAFYGSYLLDNEHIYMVGLSSIYQSTLYKTSNQGMHWEKHIFYVNNNEATLMDVVYYDENYGIIVSVLWNGNGGITINYNNKFYSRIIPFPLFAIDKYKNFIVSVGENGIVLYSHNYGEDIDYFIIPDTYRHNDVSIKNLIDVRIVGNNGFFCHLSEINKMGYTL